MFRSFEKELIETIAPFFQTFDDTAERSSLSSETLALFQLTIGLISPLQFSDKWGIMRHILWINYTAEIPVPVSEVAMTVKRDRSMTLLMSLNLLMPRL